MVALGTYFQEGVLYSGIFYVYVQVLKIFDSACVCMLALVCQYLGQKVISNYLFCLKYVARFEV
jgi:hypothetical protein